MKTLEFITTPVDGKIVIEVPEDLDGVALKVLVFEEEVVSKKFIDMEPAERVKELMTYWGTAKYPDFPISKYNVYEQ